jgi:hypothetical protein
VGELSEQVGPSSVDKPVDQLIDDRFDHRLHLLLDTITPQRRRHRRAVGSVFGAGHA